MLGGFGCLPSSGSLTLVSILMAVESLRVVVVKGHEVSEVMRYQRIIEVKTRVPGHPPVLCNYSNTAVGHVCFAMRWPGEMYIGTLLIGLGYGADWAIVPAAASESSA
ncbi:hypothetical protein SLEP1_g48221 [Rubroshorea leprosula]|uniref:Uncharacterized protein n=1 Tax=Rubroshorea leprosula TaxID=152421 RepID=A0AAV5LV93_9ROSI|nr:hypothetical protein SLEP1_g48221 [Rubroshorea leprosula]